MGESNGLDSGSVTAFFLKYSYVGPLRFFVQ